MHSALPVEYVMWMVAMEVVVVDVQRLRAQELRVGCSERVCKEVGCGRRR